VGTKDGKREHVDIEISYFWIIENLQSLLPQVYVTAKLKGSL
jgi:hypothetical protein